MTLATGTRLGSYKHINPVSHPPQDLRGSLSLVEVAKESSDSCCRVGPVGLQACLTKGSGDSARELVKGTGHDSIISKAALVRAALVSDRCGVTRRDHRGNGEDALSDSL
jgi:hypothetical protein